MSIRLTETAQIVGRTVNNVTAFYSGGDWRTVISFADGAFIVVTPKQDYGDSSYVLCVDDEPINDYDLDALRNFGFISEQYYLDAKANNERQRLSVAQAAERDERETLKRLMEKYSDC